jgi:putative intracellular protease/amidase
MVSANLRGVRVAILATDGFEQAELLEPRKALDDAGVTTMVVSPKRHDQGMEIEQERVGARSWG